MWIVYDYIRTRMAAQDTFQDCRVKIREAARARYGAHAATVVDIAFDLTGVPNGGNNLRPVNVSSRVPVDSNNPLIIGFVLNNAGSAKQMLIRAAGPALVSQGVSDACPDPYLSLNQYVGPGWLSLGANDHWDWALQPISDTLGAFPFSQGSHDAAMLPLVTSGVYSAVIGGTTGQVLGEFYDTDPNNAKQIINLAERGLVTPDAPMQMGFVIQGSGTKRILVRAISSILAGQGVQNPIADPFLEIVVPGAGVVYENDNWSTQPNASTIQSLSASLGAAYIAPGSVDAAALVDLPAGIYTVVVHGGTGTALAELYLVD